MNNPLHPIEQELLLEVFFKAAKGLPSDHLRRAADRASAKSLTNRGLLVESRSNLQLTTQGKVLAEQIASDLAEQITAECVA